MFWTTNGFTIFFATGLLLTLTAPSEGAGSPVFAYPQKLPDGYTTQRYFGAISSDASSDELVLRVETIGPYNATYRMDPSLLITPPFTVNSTDGTITTSEDYAPTQTSPRQFRFNVEARDTDPYSGATRMSSAEVLINLIEDYNRFTLVLHRSSKEVAVEKRQTRRALQDKYGYIALIKDLIPGVTLNGDQPQEEKA